MLPDISDTENKVLCDLVLNLEIPVLHHAGSPIEGQHCIDPILTEILQGRISIVAGRAECRKTSVERLYGRKVVAAGEVGIDCCTTRQKRPEVGVTQRSIVDAICAPNYRVSHEIR